MAENDWDIRTIPDYLSDGTLHGFLLQIHRGDQNILTTSPMVSPGLGSALIGAAKIGTTTDVQAVGAFIYGGWWSNEVAARGLADAVRQALKAFALAKW
jgi:hypothetical protein